VLWIAVEKYRGTKLSAGGDTFPQVIHKYLWTEKGLIYKGLHRFCTFTQALLLVLVLYLIFELLVLEKSRQVRTRQFESDRNGTKLGYNIAHTFTSDTGNIWKVFRFFFGDKLKGRSINYGIQDQAECFERRVGLHPGRRRT
jgi:hypothetical protein